MIRNKLASILADRNLKITKVSKETGISRNTITSTAQNDSKMIQMETINSICRYLGILPGDFFEYVPYDVKVTTYLSQFRMRSLSGVSGKYSSDPFLICNFDIFLEVEEERGLKSSFDLNANIKEYSDNMEKLDDRNPDFAEKLFEAHLIFDVNFEDQNAAGKFEKNYWDELSIPFREEIFDDIAISIKNALLSGIKTFIEEDEPFVTNQAVFLSKGNFIFNFDSESKFLIR